MAVKTERLGLNKTEGKDLVRSLLITLLNENWEILDKLARETDLNDHIDDINIHVTKDGTLQNGLNAEKVGGLTSEELLDHDHSDLYYTREEADNEFAGSAAVYTKDEADQKFAALDDVYTKDEADQTFASLDDVYTKDEADQTFASKEEVYTKEEADEKFTSLDNIYTKDEADQTFAALADVYTKEEADQKFASAEHGHLWKETINFSNLDFCFAMETTHTGSPSWELYEGGYSGITYTGGSGSGIDALCTRYASTYSLSLIFSLDSQAAGRVRLICDYLDEDNYAVAELNVQTAALSIIRRENGSNTTVSSVSLSSLPSRSVSNELSQFPSFGPAVVFHIKAEEELIHVKVGTINTASLFDVSGLDDVATIDKNLSMGQFGFGIADGDEITLHHAVLEGF